MKTKKKNEKSCWDCKYHDIEGTTFLGKCLWFEEHGMAIKEIPPDRVDEGCKLFEKTL